MTAETDIAAIDDGGENAAAEVRTALTGVLGRADGVLIDSTTVSTSVANVTLTGIPATFVDLLIVLVDVATADAADQDTPTLRLGNGTIDTGTNYQWWSSYNGSSSGNQTGNNSTGIPTTSYPVVMGAGDTADPKGGYAHYYVHAYTGSHYKLVTFEGSKRGDTFYLGHGRGLWRSVAAIDQVRVSAEGGNLEAGSIALYGIGR